MKAIPGNGINGAGIKKVRTVNDDPYTLVRERMVEYQVEGRGVHDKRILDAMKQIPRHLFVPPELREAAYQDRPLPIGRGQTISQPYIVAVMTELLQSKRGGHGARNRYGKRLPGRNPFKTGKNRHYDRALTGNSGRCGETIRDP